MKYCKSTNNKAKTKRKNHYKLSRVKIEKKHKKITNAWQDNNFLFVPVFVKKINCRLDLVKGNLIIFCKRLF